MAPKPSRGPNLSLNRTIGVWPFQRLTCLYSLITLMVYLSMVHTFSLYSHCAKYLLIIGVSLLFCRS